MLGNRQQVQRWLCLRVEDRGWGARSSAAPFGDEPAFQLSAVPDGGGQEHGAGAVARAEVGPVADDEGGVRVVLVFVAEHGQQVTAAANRSAIGKLVTSVTDGSQVAGATSPFGTNAVSKDKSTAYVTVTYKVASDDLTDASKTDLTKAVEQARDAGLTVEVGGSALETDSGDGLGEVLGVLVAAVVLLITFGSLAAAGLPLLTAILGVCVSLAGITAVSSAFGFSSTVGELAMMLGLAVGIDYSLFVVSRYREERSKGHQPQEAAALAAGTAGSAVVFAGLTVVIALLGLSVIGVPMLTKMGIGSAGAVVVGVLVALTAVPALLGFWPNAVLARRDRKGVRPARIKVFSRIGRTRTSGTSAKEPTGVRWARFVGASAGAGPAPVGDRPRRARGAVAGPANGHAR